MKCRGFLSLNVITNVIEATAGFRFCCVWRALDAPRLITVVKATSNR